MKTSIATVPTSGNLPEKLEANPTAGFDGVVGQQLASGTHPCVGLRHALCAVSDHPDVCRRRSADCPILKTIPDLRAIDRLVAALDLNATVPVDSIAYKFDIVSRGTRSTYFENRPEGN